MFFLQIAQEKYTQCMRDIRQAVYMCNSGDARVPQSLLHMCHATVNEEKLHQHTLNGSGSTDEFSCPFDGTMLSRIQAKQLAA